MVNERGGRNDTEERQSENRDKGKKGFLNTSIKLTFKRRATDVWKNRRVNASQLSVRLHDSPFTELLQHIKDFLWLLGETVLAQLLQLSVRTQREMSDQKGKYEYFH